MKRIEAPHSPRHSGPGSGGGMSEFRWRAGEKEKGLELVEAVSGYLAITEKEASDLIDFGSVYVCDRMERNRSAKLSGGEQIVADLGARGAGRFYEIDPSRVIFRDRFLLAYDKEAGIASQQVPFDAYNNVYAAIVRHLGARRSGEGYAALHHRLDRETSGLLLFCLARKANEPLAAAFRERKVKKDYLAWVEGFVQNDSWSCEAPIGKAGGKYKAVSRGQGKSAATSFTVLCRQEGRSLVIASPHTGRTHQIRIHLALAGHPVAGDRAHGANPAGRLYLHAWRLRLKHPVSGELLSLEAPVPAGWPDASEMDSLPPCSGDQEK